MVLTVFEFSLLRHMVVEDLVSGRTAVKEADGFPEVKEAIVFTQVFIVSRCVPAD